MRISHHRGTQTAPQGHGFTDVTWEEMKEATSQPCRSQFWSRFLSHLGSWPAWMPFEVPSESQRQTEKSYESHHFKGSLPSPPGWTVCCPSIPLRQHVFSHVFFTCISTSHHSTESTAMNITIRHYHTLSVWCRNMQKPHCSDQGQKTSRHQGPNVAISGRSVTQAAWAPLSSGTFPESGPWAPHWGFAGEDSPHYLGETRKQAPLGGVNWCKLCGSRFKAKFCCKHPQTCGNWLCAPGALWRQEWYFCGNISPHGPLSDSSLMQSEPFATSRRNWP
jgi:hypothetical protein